ncbi:PQQ-dependent sugar dehydrogenase [Phytohabitans sp. LJ34]|uniref:PQQ-dependent sugar dehydrogenase n=1 Tax=Phytohabitans sp. LJ34 TaxID=3452217 RepID=UPI003F8C8489
MAAALVGSVVLPLSVAPAGAAAVPTGFQEQIVFSGLSQPTNIEFAPDGRVFVAEKGGAIKVFDNLADPTPTLFANLAPVVHNLADRGLLGLALAPGFPTNPSVYVLYTYDAPPGQTAPFWNDNCNSVGGDNGGRCVVTGRLSKLQAAGNVMTGTEQVLIHDWCQQYPSHSVGDLHFGADGMLYATSGDGASFVSVDYGQLGNPANPCADPPGGTMTPPGAEGGALRSQDVRTTGDPTGLDGTVLRLDPATGAAAGGNPLIGSADLNARRIVAQGLRNPFRFTIRPGTNEVWTGDVGWNNWEEVNRVTNPTAAVTNFGWPCYEGGGRMGSYDSANLNLCESLYGAGQTAPHFAYSHSAKVVAGEACPSGGSAVSGAAFYPTSGGPYPAQYQGALFFADYARNCIWAMKPATAGGLPSAANIETFASGAANPVDLAVGPGDELYYADLGGGTVRRIRYFPGNQPPTAVVNAQPTTGTPPLTVAFDGTASTDPDLADAGRLTYQWDFTNDGTVDSTAATATFTYPTAGTYTAKLTVTDTLGVADSETVTISPGNNGPTAVIDTPAASLTWSAGEQVSFTGHATDPQQGALPASALTWQLRLQHCYTADNCHTHVIQDWAGVASGSFIAPDHEYPAYLELVLTAADSDGLTHTVVRRLDPKTVALTFASNPSGRTLSVGSVTRTAPFTVTAIQGSTTTVSAPTPQTGGAASYTFDSWSDGGAQTHLITAPAAPTTYTATYDAVTAPVLGHDQVGTLLDSGDMNFMNGSRFVTGAASHAVTSMSVYMKTVRPAPSNQYQLAIYTDVNGSPGALVASTTSGSLTANSWNSRPITATLAANTAYWLMYNTNGDNNVSYDTAAAGSGAWSNNSQTFGTWPSTFGASTKSNFKISIYATGGSDTDPPTVASTVPTPGATNVSTTAPARVTFSEAMDPARINTTNIELRTAGGSLVNRTVTYDAATASAVVTPAAALALGATYTVTVKGGSSGVVDAVGNPLAADHQFSFTTSSQPPPTIFGYQQIGALLDSGDMNFMNGSRFVTGAAPHTVTSMSVYMKTVRPAPNNQYQLAVYTDVNGSPGALVASTTSGSLTANSWNSRPITATLAANTAYWLMYNTNGDNNVSYDTAAAGSGAWSNNSQTFGTWPSTFGPSTKSNFKISIYAN